MIAVAKATGQELWRYDTRKDGALATFHADMLLFEDLLVVASDGSPDSQIYAFSQADGRLIWKHPWPAGVSSPLLTDGHRVFALGAGVSALALEAKTGQLLWQVPLSELRQTRSRPVLQQNRLYVALEDSSVLALEATTGNILWRRQLNVPLNPALALADNTLHVADLAGHLHFLATTTGELKGAYPLDGKPYGALQRVGDLLLVQVAPGTLLGLEAESGAERWRFAQEEELAFVPLLLPGRVVVGGAARTISTLSLAEGRLLGEAPIDGVVRSLASDGAALYVGTLSGRLLVLPAIPGTNAAR